VSSSKHILSSPIFPEIFVLSSTVNSSKCNFVVS
jgi:hypothetical protein